MVWVTGRGRNLRASKLAKGYDNNEKQRAKHENSNSCEPHEHLYDLHNFSYKFNILTHNSEFNLGTLKEMRGWSYRQVKQDGYTIQVMPRCIKVFGNKRFKTTNPIETEKLIQENTVIFILGFAKKYGFEIDPTPYPVAKEVKCLDYKVAENFRTRNFKSVYPLPSPVEFTNPSHAVKDSVRFITQTDEIKDMLYDFSINLKKHMGVLSQMDSTLKDISVSVKKPSLWTRIKRLIK